MCDMSFCSLNGDYEIVVGHPTQDYFLRGYWYVNLAVQMMCMNPPVPCVWVIFGCVVEDFAHNILISSVCLW